jgi:phosphoketolase
VRQARYDEKTSRMLAATSSLLMKCEFSWPAAFPSHLYPGIPGTIHKGGELGYALATVFDNPDLLVACIVGDGEAETGPTATSRFALEKCSKNHRGGLFKRPEGLLR